MSLTYTKSISNGKLKTAKMEMGSSVSGELVRVNDSQYGPVYVLNVNGKEVTLYPSGNLKFLAADIESGKRQLNVQTTITRVADKSYKGYPVTQFTIDQTQNAQAATSSTAAPSTDNVATKLAAIRANRK